MFLLTPTYKLAASGFVVVDFIPWPWRPCICELPDLNPRSLDRRRRTIYVVYHLSCFAIAIVFNSQHATVLFRQVSCLRLYPALFHLFNPAVDFKNTQSSEFTRGKSHLFLPAPQSNLTFLYYVLIKLPFKSKPL